MPYVHAPATSDQYVVLATLMTGADQSQNPYLVTRARTLLRGHVLTNDDFRSLMPALIEIQARPAPRTVS